jgi:hypothetical protein
VHFIKAYFLFVKKSPNYFVRKVVNQRKNEAVDQRHLQFGAAGWDALNDHTGGQQNEEGDGKKGHYQKHLVFKPHFFLFCLN